jgi:hypothetical protein
MFKTMLVIIASLLAAGTFLGGTASPAFAQAPAQIRIVA